MRISPISLSFFSRYRYDPNGNQLVRETETLSPAGTAGESAMGFDVGGSCIELREYNGFGQLASVYIDGTSAAYRYKPDGLRYEKTVDGVAETHVWNGTNLVAEIHADGTVKAKYLRGINLLCREDASRQKEYYLFNAHGDVVQKRDADSGDLWYYVYDAFGVERDVDGQDKSLDGNPFRYCGEYFDGETETIYLRARYYCPAIGRFLGEDPVCARLNWYTYCGNNPTTYVDSQGLDHYIFFGDDQAFAAQSYRHQLMSIDSGNHVPIHMIYVDTNTTFYEEWAKMGVNSDGSIVPIDSVIVNLHGDPNRIVASDGTNIDVPSLESKYFDYLYLLSCNTGHLDYSDTNIAKQFLDANDVKIVIAPDGTHYRYPEIGLFGRTVGIINAVVGDETFDYWTTEAGQPLRESCGWIAYGYLNADQEQFVTFQLSPYWNNPRPTESGGHMGRRLIEIIQGAKNADERTFNPKR